MIGPGERANARLASAGRRALVLGALSAPVLALFELGVRGGWRAPDCLLWIIVTLFASPALAGAQEWRSRRAGRDGEVVNRLVVGRESTLPGASHAEPAEDQGRAPRRGAGLDMDEVKESHVHESVYRASGHREPMVGQGRIVWTCCQCRQLVTSSAGASRCEQCQLAVHDDCLGAHAARDGRLLQRHRSKPEPKCHSTRWPLYEVLGRSFNAASFAGMGALLVLSALPALFDGGWRQGERRWGFPLIAIGLTWVVSAVLRAAFRPRAPEADACCHCGAVFGSAEQVVGCGRCARWMHPQCHRSRARDEELACLAPKAARSRASRSPAVSWSGSLVGATFGAVGLFAAWAIGSPNREPSLTLISVGVLVCFVLGVRAESEHRRHRRGFAPCAHCGRSGAPVWPCDECGKDVHDACELTHGRLAHPQRLAAPSAPATTFRWDAFDGREGEGPWPVDARAATPAPSRPKGRSKRASRS